MEQVQGASGQAMLIVNSAGGVQWLCRQARQWLQEFLGLELEADAALPPGVARWLNDYSQHRANPDHTLHAPPSALRFSRPQGFLQIRRAAEDAGGNITLLLTIERPANQAMPLRIPGLTPRENEVLGWIAHGKGNPEIAAILGLSVRTVYKHVENIFPKLDVENRRGAMLRAISAASALDHE
jgi:DNA-binding CsgD family transcriptional regulator